MDRAKGLVNMGNTCYLNASLQCLAACYPLNIYLLHPARKLKLNEPDARLTETYIQLLNALFLPSGDKTVFPKMFKDILNLIEPRFNNNEQHDAHECITYILEILHKSLREDYPYNFSGDNMPLYQIEWYKFLKSENSVISHLFYGQLQTQIRCSVCDQSSFQYDPFHCLSIPLSTPQITQGIPTPPVTLEQSLELFSAVEILCDENAWECPTCKKKTKSLQQIGLWKLPQIFLIHLKRFNGIQKIRYEIQFPARMVIQEPCSSEMKQYELYGIVNHQGELNFGHYTSFVRIIDNWFFVNDTQVGAVQFGEILKSDQPYILFYIRKNSN